MKIKHKLFFTIISMLLLSVIALAASVNDNSAKNVETNAANFYIIPSTIPLTINFIDQSTGSPTSWSWSFGDGSTSTAKDPIHTYAIAGKYTVTLTVKYGADTKTKIAIIWL